MMLTFLSRSIRQLVSTATPQRPVTPPALRLVGAAGDCDIAIAVPAARPVAAFVAGEGARIYSLDVFRAPGPRRPRAA